MTVWLGALASQVARLLLPLRWEVSAAGTAAADLSDVLRVSGRRRLVLFVPPSTEIPSRLAQILVPHDGCPSTCMSLDTIAELVAQTLATVVLLHVAGTELPSESGSFQALRMVDHAGNDWTAWRDQFIDNVFRGWPQIPLQLHLSTGPPAEAILEAARRLRSDLVVMAWSGVLREGRASTLRSVCADASFPVLLVPART
jgi:nucleotide-binding universal stress UspA family protein